MIYRSTQKEIKEYFDSPRINQSTLKKFTSGLQGYLKKEKEDKEDSPEKIYFIMGSLVDFLLTGIESEFEDLYYVSTLQKLPTEKIKNIIDDVFDEIMVSGGKLELTDKIILKYSEIREYQKNWKDETKIKKIKSEGAEYLEEKTAAIGKTMITDEILGKALEIVESFKKSERTKNLFPIFPKQELDYYYQKIIYFTYRGIKMKAMLDGVIINHNLKVVNAFDIKTSFDSAIKFVYSAKKHGYPIQTVVYIEAVKAWIKKEFPSYTFGDFYFAVESTARIGNPLLYKVDKSFVEVGYNGFKPLTAYSDTRIPIEIRSGVKGLNKLIDEYKFYEATEYKEDILTADKEIINLGYNGIQ